MNGLEKWIKFLDQDSQDSDWDFTLTEQDWKELYEQQTECSHKFVEMGFMFSKKICNKCDLEEEVFLKKLHKIKHPSDMD